MMKITIIDTVRFSKYRNTVLAKICHYHHYFYYIFLRFVYFKSVWLRRFTSFTNRDVLDTSLLYEYSNIMIFSNTVIFCFMIIMTVKSEYRPSLYDILKDSDSWIPFKGFVREIWHYLLTVVRLDIFCWSEVTTSVLDELTSKCIKR